MLTISFATESLEVYQKNGSWVRVDGAASGWLTYEAVYPTFDYSFVASGLNETTGYSLIYYPDGWPGIGLIVLGSGTSDANGEISLSGSLDTFDQLPLPGDTNYPSGAKIWLVFTADVNESTGSMSAWNQPDYLFEDHLITYSRNGTISGTVSNGSSGVQGVILGLYEGTGTSGDLLTSTVSDVDGNYTFDLLAPGTYTVDCVLPLGFVFIYGSTHPIYDLVIPIGGAAINDVDFFMETTEIYHVARSSGFWKHQFKANFFTNGNNNNNVYHSPDQLVGPAPSYAEDIHSHYYHAQVNPIQIEGVTYMDSSGCAVQMDEYASTNTLSINGNDMYGRACKEFLALLLNIVSGRLPQYIQFTQDGLFVTQAVVYINDLMFDDPADPDDPYDLVLAKDIAETMNHGVELDAGVIPPDTPYYLYSFEEVETMQTAALPETFTFTAYPNPFNPVTILRYDITEGSQVTLGVYDITGRLAATLIDGWRDSGGHEALFDAAGLASGIYFARLQAGDQISSVKLLLLK